MTTYVYSVRKASTHLTLLALGVTSAPRISLVLAEIRHLSIQGSGGQATALSRSTTASMMIHVCKFHDYDFFLEEVKNLIAQRPTQVKYAANAEGWSRLGLMLSSMRETIVLSVRNAPLSQPRYL